MKKNLLLIVLFFSSLFSHYSYAQLLKTLYGHDGDVLCVKFFPSTKYFATGGTDDNVIIWNYDTFTQKKKLESNLSNILSIAISGDETKIFTSHDRPAIIDHGANNRAIALWDLNYFKESYPIALDGQLKGVCTSSDGNKIYYAFYDLDYYPVTGGYSITESVIYNECDIKTGNVKEFTAGEDTYTQSSTASRSKGSYSMNVIKVNRNTIAASLDNGYIALINTDDKKATKYLFTDKNKFSGDCFDASPDGKLIAAANYGGENWIYLWNVQSGTSTKTFKGHENDVMCVAFSPDNNYLASGDQDGKIVLWEVKSGKKIKSLTGHSGDVNCITFSPDGKYIISGGNDKLVKVWDAIAMIPDLKIYATEYELKYGILKKLQDELKEQSNLLESNFTPKGEFETTEAFELRLKEKNDKINGINKFYQAKFEELKDRKKQELDVLEDRKQSENEMAIQNSRRDTTVNISNVSTYNADKQTYAITIKGMTKNVYIPIDKAPKFKENWKKAKVKCKKQLFDDLKNYKYFDFVIIDPVTSEEIIFEDVNEKK